VQRRFWPSFASCPPLIGFESLFGSVVRGEASEASDVDVLVDFVGPATFDGYMGLKFFLEDTLCVRVDLVTRAALKPRLRAGIEAEAQRVA
jgi:hypothetical protein